MKRILTLALILVLALTLAACGGTDSPSAQSPDSSDMPADIEPDISSEPAVGEQDEADISEPAVGEQDEADTGEPADSSAHIGTSYITNTLQLTQTDPDGYQVEANISTGEWIKASDSDFLANAFTSLGGDTDSSAYNTLMGYFTDSNENFRTDRSVIAFGTVSFKNITPGFDITEQYPLDVKLNVRFTGVANEMRWSGDSYSDGTEGKIWIVYSNGLTDAHWTQGQHRISPHMTGNQWGPIVFAIAVDKVFTPNYPEGNPALDDVAVEFWFSDILERQSAHFEKAWGI
jgi:hypothetical protein